MDLPIVYMKPQRSPHNVEALNTGGARVHNQHIASGIADNLENMRMSADENIRFVFIDQSTGLHIIPARISSDVSHQDLHSFTLEEPVDRMGEAKIEVIAIAGNTNQGLEGSDLLRQVHSTAKITSVPYLVHWFKEITELLIENAVGI